MFNNEKKLYFLYILIFFHVIRGIGCPFAAHLKVEIEPSTVSTSSGSTSHVGGATMLTF